MVAQAAGHRDRDEYNPRLGPNPEAMPRFQGMVASILPSIDRQIRQMQEVWQLDTAILQKAACTCQTHHGYLCRLSCCPSTYVMTFHVCCLTSTQEASKSYQASQLCIYEQYAAMTLSLCVGDVLDVAAQSASLSPLLLDTDAAGIKALASQPTLHP